MHVYLELEGVGVHHSQSLRQSISKHLLPKNWSFAFPGKGNALPTLVRSEPIHYFAPNQDPLERNPAPQQVLTRIIQR